MSDERKDFILSTVANYFGTGTKDSSVEGLRNNEHLINFLDTPNANILSASLEKLPNGSVKYHLDETTNVGKTKERVLVLFKSRPEVITPDNLHSTVLVNTMLNSPVSSLYHSLHQIYTPLLLKDAKWSQEFDPKLQGLITELEKGLGTLMRRSGDHTGGKSTDGFSSILTPNDEAQYWADEANTNKKRDKREMASAFYAALEPISTEFSKIDSLQLVDAEEVFETVHNSLDDLWKIDEWEYPQKRMVHLMDVLANAVTRFIQNKCTNLDIWKGSFLQIEESLLMVISPFLIMKLSLTFFIHRPLGYVKNSCILVNN